MGLGNTGYFHPDRNAAAVGDIRLGKRDRAGGDEILKLVKGMHILAGGDGQGRLPGDPDVPGQVVGNRRLLQPVDVELGEGPGGADRLFYCPAHVRIHHEGDIRPDEFSNGGHAGDIFG